MTEEGGARNAAAHAGRQLEMQLLHCGGWPGGPCVAHGACGARSASSGSVTETLGAAAAMVAGREEGGAGECEGGSGRVSVIIAQRSGAQEGVAQWGWVQQACVGT